MTVTISGEVDTLSGPEHYLESERLLDVALAAPGGSEREQYALAAAQVHATLALVAVTAEVGAGTTGGLAALDGYGRQGTYRGQT